MGHAVAIQQAEMQVSTISLERISPTYQATESLPRQIHEWQSHHQQNCRHLGTTDNAEGTDQVA